VVVERDESVRAKVEEACVADAVVASFEDGDALADRDLVVLAAPVAVVEAQLGPASDRMRDGAILTDVAGVKAPLLSIARARVRAGVRFVGAHPMFGGESGGFSAASAERWRGGRVAVCTEGDPAAVADVASLHRALGAEVVLCTAREHDEAMAAVSHLPYVVASALARIGDESGPLAARLAGRGYADATRLAGFAYDVQGAVARRNSALPAALARLRAELDRLEGALAREDETEARARFEGAKAARARLREGGGAR
jgi:prephenate dehydrogenase